MLVIHVSLLLQLAAARKANCMAAVNTYWVTDSLCSKYMQSLTFRRLHQLNVCLAAWWRSAHCHSMHWEFLQRLAYNHMENVLIFRSLVDSHKFCSCLGCDGISVKKWRRQCLKRDFPSISIPRYVCSSAKQSKPSVFSLSTSYSCDFISRHNWCS